MSSNYAVSTLQMWFEKNQPVFKSRKTDSAFKDSGHGSANVQLDTGIYLVDISAWNHASCLDIQIFDIKTDQSVFPHIGDCASKAEFDGFLEELISWYKSAHE